MKYAFRILVREKTFSIVAVVTLGLGIGAVTAVFSVVDNVLLKPIMYRDPARLYTATESAPQVAHLYPRLPVNAAHFSWWRKQCVSCLQGALLRPDAFNLTDGEPERLSGVSTTWELFQVLGVEAQLGRTFTESDDQPGNNKYVVITDGLWRRRFNADRGIVGKPVQLYGEPHVIIGVLPAGFRFMRGQQLGPVLRLPERVEIFKPLGLDWEKQRRAGSHSYLSLIRLRPAATIDQAQSEMTAAIVDAGREVGMDLKAHLTPLQEQMTGSSRSSLWMLFVAVGAVLLIVCVNLGNLMFVRSTGRLRDAAICFALGATRTQVFKPIVAESLIVAFAGGSLGVLTAYAAVRLLVGTAPVDIPRLDEVHLNFETLLFAFLVSTVCGVFCGSWPAWRLGRYNLTDGLKPGSRPATDTTAQLRMRQWLVGLEVALSTGLLILAGLLGVSFFRLMNVERGFEVEHIATADITLPLIRYSKDEQIVAFHRQMLEKLATLPGTKAVALVSTLPLRGENFGNVITKEGDTRPPLERPLAEYRLISSDYFQTMGIPLRIGRLPQASDLIHKKVALLSESAASKVWPGENPVGKRIKDNERTEMVEVIGVVADVRTNGLDKQPPLMVYVPYWDQVYWLGRPLPNISYIVRTSHDPSTMGNAFLSTLRSVDSELPLTRVRSMREIMTESLGLRRFRTLLAAAFAGSALLLVCVGIYGVLSYTVTRRTTELGIRTALGAQAPFIMLSVLQQGLKPVAVGLIAGVFGASWIGRLLSGLFFGVSAHDPLTIFLVVFLELGVAVVACWIPARRASRLDPMTALRNE